MNACVVITHSLSFPYLFWTLYTPRGRPNSKNPGTYEHSKKTSWINGVSWGRGVRFCVIATGKRSRAPGQPAREASRTSHSLSIWFCLNPWMCFARVRNLFLSLRHFDHLSRNNVESRRNSIHQSIFLETIAELSQPFSVISKKFCRWPKKWTHSGILHRCANNASRFDAQRQSKSCRGASVWYTHNN